MGRRENIRAAKEKIADNRRISIETYENHIKEVAAKCPEFEGIISLLAGTAPRIMAAAMKGSESGETIDSIRKEYENIVELKKKVLTSLSYPADYCDIKYRCPKCSDTGYVGINICECLKKELVKVSMMNSGLYSLTATQNFDSFSLDYYTGADKTVMVRNVSIMKRFTETFEPGISDSFIFIGATGLGKTHLSTAAATEIIKKGYYVVYESASAVFEDFEKKKFSGRYSEEADGECEKYTDCDLLIIDDLGCEMTNQFTLSCLYNIINTRMIRHKSTIISTNLGGEELRKRYSDRIVSRVFGDYKPLTFRGSDIRAQKLNKTQK